MSGPSGRKAKDHEKKKRAPERSRKRASKVDERSERVPSKVKDEARTLALLWAPEQRTGRSGLTVHAIVAAALKLAEVEGLEAVSMRRVADSLEVGTMTLYSHVPGKAELTDLMVDAAYGELYEHVDQAKQHPGGYRARIGFIAERYKWVYTRHPWLLDVPLGRPVLGPKSCMKYETELRAIDGIGLTPLQMDSVVAMLVMQVQSTARVRVADLRAQQTSGMTEVEWWLATVPLLQQVRTVQFPVAARVGKAAGQALAPGPLSEHLYRFGLDVLCEAVTAMIARNRAG